MRELQLLMKTRYLEPLLEKRQMNLSLLPQTAPLMWHVLIETLEAGQVAGWIAELPECRVVAESQEAAIASLQALLNQRMATIKVLPLQLSTENAESSWVKLAGALKDDASFVTWSDRFWAEKQNAVDDDELSVEESLRLM
jgi:hypothetical protein